MNWGAVALYGGRTSGGEVAAATTAYLSTTGIFWHHESVTPTASARPDRVPADTSYFGSSPAVTQAAWSVVTGHTFSLTPLLCHQLLPSCLVTLDRAAGWSLRFFSAKVD